MRTATCFRLFLLSILPLIVAGGCSPSSSTPMPRPRDFGVDDLLIDVSVFSPDWHRDGPAKEAPYELKPSDVEEDLYIQFSPSDSMARATHAICRFRDTQAAASGYRCFLNSWFYNADRVTTWEAPDWMQYRSTVADQFQFACADFYGGYPKTRSQHCVAVGQYKEYVSAFSIGVSPPEGMTDHSMLLEQVLQTIDERMAFHLTD
jgi:hypothetical protein